MTDDQINQRLAEWMFPPCPNGTTSDRQRRESSIRLFSPLEVFRAAEAIERRLWEEGESMECHFVNFGDHPGLGIISFMILGTAALFPTPLPPDAGRCVWRRSSGWMRKEQQINEWAY